ncbi:MULTISPECIES: LuxR C-terminal-related transcriptional regulator [unclassified Brenneria]|uniref:LuxR C-terminal-related transcriptional regulator n=1 Tax=unclassified Brenneria TaxID=2634434 RepID=UPI001553F7C9|nr:MULTISPECIES: LuxR C-terminal-related transcriptional regulator [unclassified Brenneria]MBJ7222766.1 LuxR family transcriptional regulator [Brenneria sp. L3-3C-1]MEE3644010.1 LuxR C-terminal-related transcriptional regulator [Brenneria sp. L3_3C_1]MEE3651888.1 LuxR C-terminal-related transcriptional regulator [Brenneria sp. HEZEL_4_2_4]NPD01848.1 LuxR family transcriptional regulator [Brenneria sp. hezel4-2-4]
MLYVRPTNRFTLPQGKTKCIFIIDGSSEGFEEYYESVRSAFYNMAASFIIINNSPYHPPVCIDEKTVLISKSSPIESFYKLLDVIPPYGGNSFNPVRLSKSEYAVFQYWSSGYSAESISEIIGLNKKSVLNSKSRLLNKYGVQDKNSLLLIAKILFKEKVAGKPPYSSESTQDMGTAGSLLA